MASEHNRSPIHLSTNDTVGYTNHVHQPLAAFQGDQATTWEVRGRLRIGLWLVVLVSAVVQLPRLISSLHPPQPARVDFFQEWAAAKNVHNGDSAYGSLELAAAKYVGWSVPKDGRRLFVEVNAHPPASVLLALPLARLNFDTAFQVWTALSFLLFVFSVVAIGRELKFQASASSQLLLFGLAVTSGPFVYQMLHGQLNFVLLAFVTTGWIAERHGKSSLAAVSWGIATSIKLIPAIFFIYLLFRRRWSAALTFIATIAALTLLSVMILGFEDHRYFVTHVVPSVGEWRSGWNNGSLLGFWSRLFDAGSKHRMVTEIVHLPWLAKIGSAICTSLILGMLYRITRRESVHTTDQQISAFVIAMLLISPTCWLSYGVLLAIPVLFLLREIGNAHRLFVPMCVCLGLIWLDQEYLQAILMLGPQPPEARSSYIATPAQSLLILSLPCYAMCGLLVIAKSVSDTNHHSPKVRSSSKV